LETHLQSQAPRLMKDDTKVHMHSFLLIEEMHIENGKEYLVPNCLDQSCTPFKKFLKLLERVHQSLQLSPRTSCFFLDSK
jgi:hypothetical protein